MSSGSTRSGTMLPSPRSRSDAITTLALVTGSTNGLTTRQTPQKITGGSRKIILPSRSGKCDCRRPKICLRPATSMLSIEAPRRSKMAVSLPSPSGVARRRPPPPASPPAAPAPPSDTVTSSPLPPPSSLAATPVALATATSNTQQMNLFSLASAAALPFLWCFRTGMMTTGLPEASAPGWMKTLSWASSSATSDCLASCLGGGRLRGREEGEECEMRKEGGREQLLKQRKVGRPRRNSQRRVQV